MTILIFTSITIIVKLDWLINHIVVKIVLLSNSSYYVLSFFEVVATIACIIICSKHYFLHAVDRHYYFWAMSMFCFCKLSYVLFVSVSVCAVLWVLK